jgi:hypothetical protein
MKVREFIEILKRLDQDREVWVLSNGRGSPLAVINSNVRADRSAPADRRVKIETMSLMLHQAGFSEEDLADPNTSVPAIVLVPED